MLDLESRHAFVVDMRPHPMKGHWHHSLRRQRRLRNNSACKEYATTVNIENDSLDAERRGSFVLEADHGVGAPSSMESREIAGGQLQICRYLALSPQGVARPSA